LVYTVIVLSLLGVNLKGQKGGNCMTSADVIGRLLDKIEELERELELLSKNQEQKQAKD